MGVQKGIGVVPSPTITWFGEEREIRELTISPLNPTMIQPGFIHEVALETFFFLP